MACGSAWLAMAGLFSNKSDDISALYRAQWHALEIFALLVLTVAAAESAIGLAILVVYSRVRGTIAVESIRMLNG